MDRRARREARDRAFARKNHPGRKPGPVPLPKDKRRFEVALFHMLTQTRLQSQAARAGEFAAAVLHEKTIPRIINGGMSFEFWAGRVGDGESARENRGWKLVREAPGIIASAEGNDRVWLEASAKALHVAFNAIYIDDTMLLRDSLKLLDRLGWREPLARLFTVQS